VSINDRFPRNRLAEQINRGELLRYCVAGVIAAASDMALFFTTIALFGVHYLLANIIGFAGGLVVAYLLNTQWVFLQRNIKSSQLEALLFALIVLLGLGVSELVLFLTAEGFGLSLTTAKIIALGCATTTNFTMKKLLLFRSAEQSQQRPVTQQTGSTANNTLEHCPNCKQLVPRKDELLVPAFDGETAGKRFFNLAHCGHCDLTVTVGVTQEDLAAAYSNSYYGEGKAKFHSLIEALIGRGVKRRAVKLSTATTPENARRFLDIGCGRGVLLQEMNKLGWKVLGTELNKHSMHDDIKDHVFVGSILDAKFPKEKYEVINVWHVLEHLHDIDRILDKIADITAPNGRVIMAIPNYDSFQQRLFAEEWLHLDAPRHLTHIKSAWLIKGLESRGFTVESEHHIDVTQNVFGFLQSSLNLLFPRKRNQLYQDLHSGNAHNRNTFQFLGHLIIAGLIIPLALVDLAAGAAWKKGATVQIRVRQTA
jgi:putative flippase GtrA/2-polyprenyl-3-methyl-5-hydroxy-6-metoxy-1,4-benzoquinol methylase